MAAGKKKAFSLGRDGLSKTGVNGLIDALKKILEKMVRSGNTGHHGTTAKTSLW